MAGARHHAPRVREIRSVCVWRQAPMFYVDCQGRLLDKYEPAVKEFTSWNGHAFFYKSAGTVARCEPIGSQAKRRSSRTGGSGRARSPAATSTPRTWSRSGVELLAEGHCPKMVMRRPAAEGARRRGLRHLRV